MTRILGLPKPSQGLGDLLTITPICKLDPTCVVEIATRSARFARFFRNISSEVRITDDHVQTNSVGDGHESQRRLRAVGLPVDDYVPYVHVSEEEKLRGKELISQYPNPLVLISNCSGFWKDYREIPQSQIQRLVDALHKDFTILHYGLSNNVMDLNNVIPVYDLSIDDLICHYAAVGRYIGISTGDLMLMLAVGGEVVVNVPTERFDHMMKFWGYPDCNRITYIRDNIEETINSIYKRWGKE